jgi:hypothetical protein
MSQGTNIVQSEIAGLYVNNVRIAHVTNVVINIENDLLEIAGTTTVKEFIYGRDSWTLSSDGFVTFQAGYSWDFLMELLDQYQFVTIAVPTNASGTEYLMGNALLRTNALTAGNTGEMIKMSLTFQGTGPLYRNFTSYPLNATTLKSTIDAAACNPTYDANYYFSNGNNSYPIADIGDIVYTDPALSSPLGGGVSQYIGIQNEPGVAYKIASNGEVTAKEISTCTTDPSF